MHKIYIVVILLLCTMCACNADNRPFPNELSKDQNSIQYISSTTGYETLCKVLAGKPSAQNLHERIGLDFIKSRGEGYFTIFKTEKGLIYVAFDAEKIYSYSKIIYVAEGLSDEEFKSLQIGTPLAVVREMDPDGDYSFLYSNCQRNPAISNHYLENGYQYKIFYDKSYCISHIEREFL